MSHIHTASGPQPHNPLARSLAYVIEVGETQAGIVSRAPHERYFTFVSAAAAFDGLDGHRFATPSAAELAARQLHTLRRAASRRLAA